MDCETRFLFPISFKDFFYMFVNWQVVKFSLYRSANQIYFYSLCDSYIGMMSSVINRFYIATDSPF